MSGGDGVGSVHTAVLDREPASALAGILGTRDGLGDELPPMWHLVYLLDRWTRAELGADGHPFAGLPTPPAEPHRRMFAGGRTTHLAPLRFGEATRKTSGVVSETLKEGRSGPLRFVTVRHDYEQGGQLRVSEEHDIVYRPLAPTAPPEPAGPPASTEPVAPTTAAAPVGDAAEKLDGGLRFAVDPVTLFLFSAVTANAHRIHYDLPFARSEGHLDLVVHGPLQIVLMAEALARDGADLVGARFDYRLLTPARGAQTLQVGSPAEHDASVVVLDGQGVRVARGDVLPVPSDAPAPIAAGDTVAV